MTNKLAVFGQEKAPIKARRSYDKRSSNVGAVSGERHNRCVIVPGKVEMVAEALERRDSNWFVRTKAANDLVVKIGKKNSFYLHSLPMVSKSKYLNRIVFDHKDTKTRTTSLNIHIDNLPGGAETFELVVKFCYGWKIDLTAINAAPLYCAANFLEMSNDLANNNLISRTESFLSFIIFSSWKDTFSVLKTCESISSYARELLIQKRCSEAIAWKIYCYSKSQCLDLLVESDLPGLNPLGRRSVAEDWWFEDVSALRIDHFIEVVGSIKKKGVNPEVLGSCISHWTSKWLSRISFGVHIPTQKGMNHQVRRVIVESLIRVLPVEENSVSCNFLLHLLKLCFMMKIDAGLSGKLERRIASLLEKCHPLDLLVKNYGESDTLYDVGIVARIVEAYASLSLKNPAAKVFVVGRLVDGYLTLVAKDENLRADDFRMVAESLPKNARYSHDNLYKAIDRYLKAHSNLTEDERKELCRSLEYHKLSQEAREHATKNDRLPLNITMQFVLLEQVNMVKSMVNAGSVYQRTKGQTIINLKTNSRRECMKVHKQVRVMKQEVESIKGQLDKLNLCRLALKRMAKSKRV